MHDPVSRDVRDSFASPDAEFGPVPLWWWDGEALDDERLTAQLEALDAGGVPAVCLISKFPNGPTGDRPHYFTDEWWAHVEHVVDECERLGMELWVHDETYHHSPPSWREYWQDTLRAAASVDERLRGEVLDRVALDTDDLEEGESVELAVPDALDVRTAAAYPRERTENGAGGDGTLLLDEAEPLAVTDGTVSFHPPDDREWHVTAIGSRPEGLCYTNSAAVERYLDEHFEEYVRRLGEDAVGDVLVGTFEDELVVLDGEVPCDDAVIERFRAEKGYDPLEELVALYEPVAGTTGRLRTDYHDVVTALLEEHWFEPLHEWHEGHGLARSHDNWGRNSLSTGVEQYGDYFRTMRWYREPGYDDGGPDAIGERNFLDAKVAASVAACYDRDRVWGECFHSTSWGFRPESQLAGLVENVCYGCTRYDNHGLYYTTRGGWWSHAPPDVHFRQPYWDHVGELQDAAARLSYLFSRGEPVADVGLLYPATSLHADWHPEDGVGATGREIDDETRAIAAELYEGHVDPLFVDDETLAAATVTPDGHVETRGVTLPGLVIGPTTAIRASTLTAARRVYESGGLVAAVGRLPTAVVGDRADDVDLDAELEGLFGEALADATTDLAGAQRGAAAGGLEGYGVGESEAGGTAIVVDREMPLAALLAEHREPAVEVDAPAVYHTHRRFDPADAAATAGGDDAHAVLLFNAREERRTVTADVAATGRVEEWDPLTGEQTERLEWASDGERTELTVTLPPWGFRVVVIGGEQPDASVSMAGFDVTDLTLEVDTATVRGTATVDPSVDGPTGGSARVQLRGDAADAVRATDAVGGGGKDGQDGITDLLGSDGPFIDAGGVVALDEGWTFEPAPTMDNADGDFRYPPSRDVLGPEVRSFAHRHERSDGDADAETPAWHAPEYDDADWERAMVDYGPHCWRHVGEPADAPGGATDESARAALAEWDPYEFSKTVGRPGTHPDFLGYASIVSDEFLVADDGEETHFWTCVAVTDEQAGQVLCHHGAGVERLSIGGRTVDLGEVTVGGERSKGRDGPGTDAGGSFVLDLPAGETAIHAVLAPGAESHVAFEPVPGVARERDLADVPRLRWFHDDALAFDPRPWDDEPVGRYRFTVPAGTRAFTLPVRGTAAVWVDGEAVAVEAGGETDRVALDVPVTEPTTVAVRVEQVAGAHGGAVWAGPVELDVAPIEVSVGDWRELGYGDYSGEGVYRRRVEVPAFDPAAGDRVTIDLGDVAVAATVSVDGERVGSSFSRPFTVDLTETVTPGTHEVTVRVANTLANHFAAETPRLYADTARGWYADGDALLAEFEGDAMFAGGLRGPVRLVVEPGLTVTATPERE